MKHRDVLKPRQIYSAFSDREWACFNSFLKEFKYQKAEYVRRLILASMKKAAEDEKDKGLKPQKQVKELTSLSSQILSDFLLKEKGNV